MCRLLGSSSWLGALFSGTDQVAGGWSLGKVLLALGVFSALCGVVSFEHIRVFALHELG